MDGASALSGTGGSGGSATGAGSIGDASPSGQLLWRGRRLRGEWRHPGQRPWRGRRAVPSSRVLDLGCGMGRLGAAMAWFLEPSGSYDGLDIVPDGIGWCHENIVGPHENIRFTLANVYNREYNPGGSVSAVDFVFPFPDEAFDVVVLASVFTHMLPDDVDHYLGEIARVLAPGGRCFASCYLLTPDALTRMRSKESVLTFNHNHGTYWVVSSKVPELSVGYDDGFLSDLYTKHGLSNERYPGHWCGQPSHWSKESSFGEQDVIVARKPGSTT